MVLQVVGTGFGRTGTKSLKLALERLAYGPGHHMIDVRNNLALLEHWISASQGKLPDWNLLFSGYKATVDWPSARFWREITDFYKEAKVIHTVRPVDDWLRSIQRTIFPVIQNWMNCETEDERQRGQMAWNLIGEQTFKKRIHDQAYVRSVFEAHTGQVIELVRPDHLLVFNVMEGWGSLYKFLYVEIPDQPFPNTNTTAEFIARRESINLSSG